MSAELIAETQMNELYCGSCGIIFWVPKYWYEARSIKKEQNGEFWCPNGHQRIFSEPKVDKLEKELKEERTKRWQTEMELGQEKSKREKLEKRIKNGVCPYCKRTFQNLQRHMNCKHN